MQSNDISIGVIGAAGHGKTTLVSAIKKIVSKNHLSEYNAYKFIDCPNLNEHKSEIMKQMIVENAKLHGVILIVSAKDSLEQARESVHFARQFGVENIVIFLNKTDQVDNSDALELTEMGIRDMLISYGFDGDGVLVVSGAAFFALNEDNPLCQEQQKKSCAY